MKVLFPERVVERHVGGNTVYARNLMEGLDSRDVATGLLKSGRHPALTMVRETLQGLKQGEFDQVIHFSADTGPLLPTRGPSVVTVHGVASRWISVARNSRQEWIWRTRVQRAIEGTCQLVTVSQSAADDIAEVFNYERNAITVIPHGIATSSFSPPTVPSDEVAALLPPEFVLYVGNIEPRKNLIELVTAMEELSKRGFGVPLVIAGRPAWNSAASMRKILSSSAHVIYLGFVSDADRVALMQRASLFVFPSLYEGFGFPVLEAMAAGSPVLATRQGSLAEVAGPAYEINGVDSEAIADGICRVFEGGLRWNPVDARNWLRRFSWDASVSAHIGVYEKAIQSCG